MEDEMCIALPATSGNQATRAGRKCAMTGALAESTGASSASLFALLLACLSAESEPAPSPALEQSCCTPKESLDRAEPADAGLYTAVARPVAAEQPVAIERTAVDGQPAQVAPPDPAVSPAPVTPAGETMLLRSGSKEPDGSPKQVRQPETRGEAESRPQIPDTGAPAVNTFALMRGDAAPAPPVPGAPPRAAVHDDGESANGPRGSGEVAVRVARALESARASGPPEIRMVLEPERLGSVWLRLAAAPRGLVASFRVSTDGALGAFRHSIGGLRQGLARSGVPVEHMSVGLSLAWTGGETGRNPAWNGRALPPEHGTVQGRERSRDAPVPGGPIAARPGLSTLLDTIA